jgi:hypothetical protein
MIDLSMIYYEESLSNVQPLFLSQLERQGGENCNQQVGRYYYEINTRTRTPNKFRQLLMILLAID